MNIENIIAKENDEEIVKVYDSLASKVTKFKTLLLSMVISISAVMFVLCFGIVVFGGRVKTGSFKYDTFSYWVIISFIITAFVVFMIDAIIVALTYRFLKISSAKTAAKSVKCVLTNRRIVLVNTTKNVVLASVYLSDIDDIKRYVDDQVKVMTYSGTDYVFKINDNPDFFDRYPGLIRSERQRARRLMRESADTTI